MPVAVLSSMAIGLAVDFAIHFLVRGRRIYLSLGSWDKAVPAVFAEPAKAITRNIIVIAVGFLPLLLSHLVAYRTVGILLASMLMASGIATLLILPALVKILGKYLFAPKKIMGLTCDRDVCVISSITLVLLMAISLQQYTTVGWATLVWISVIAIPVMSIGCGFLSRRQKCKPQNILEEPKKD